MRDITKRAEEGRKIIRKHSQMDLSVSEIGEFYRMMREEDPVEAIGKIFDFGVSVGSRCNK